MKRIADLQRAFAQNGYSSSAPGAPLPYSCPGFEPLSRGGLGQEEIPSAGAISRANAAPPGYYQAGALQKITGTISANAAGPGIHKADTTKSHTHALLGIVNGVWIDAPGLYITNGGGTAINLNHMTGGIQATGTAETAPQQTRVAATILI